MIVLVAPFLMKKNIQGLAIFPFLLLRNRNLLQSQKLIQHEKIHFKQQLELLWVFFFLWYIIEFTYRWIQLQSWEKAYKNVSFEKEAYANEHQTNYLQTRKTWSFWKYLKK
jgi:hypothetical protein